MTENKVPWDIPKSTSNTHEELLYQEILDLEKKGCRVIRVKRKLPDAIAITPEGKIIAVEILGRKRRTDPKGKSKGYRWDGGQSVQKKRWSYSQFDDIIFVLFDRNGSGWTHKLTASETWPDWTKNEMKKPDPEEKEKEEE